MKSRPRDFCLLHTELIWGHIDYNHQRWSTRGRARPRGHILKSLALASKPQVLENCLVLGSRTALFLNRWNFVGKRQKPCEKSVKTFFWFPQVEIAWKKIFKDFFRLKKIIEGLFFLRSPEENFLKTFFFLENTCVCVLGPWPRNFFVSLALASSLVSSTPPLIIKVYNYILAYIWYDGRWCFLILPGQIVLDRYIIIISQKTI